MKLHTLLPFLLAGFSVPALAGTNFDDLKLLSQDEFAKLAEDFTAAGSYKAVAPGEPLGITGFDVGVELTGTKLQSADVWKKAGADISVLPVPKLHVHKGLPFNIDVGASLAAVPGSDIKLFGAELRYAILEGNVAMPAVAIRGAFTKLSGVSQLELDTKSVELTVSKGFLMLTPYAGVGRVWGNVKPNVASLNEEKVGANKLFVGANFNLGLMNLAAEADRTGDNTSVSAKVGFRW